MRPGVVLVGIALVDEGGLPGLVSLGLLPELAWELLESGLRGVGVDIMVMQMQDGVGKE